MIESEFGLSARAVHREPILLTDMGRGDTPNYIVQVG